MEEKILAKGEFISGKIFRRVMILIGAAQLELCPLLIHVIPRVKYLKLSYNIKTLFAFYRRTIPYILMIYLPIFVFFVLIGCIVYWIFHRYELTVTDKRVYGGVRRRKLVLPVDSITAMATIGRRCLAVTTPSGAIRVAMLKNRDELYDAINSLLIQRQGKRTGGSRDVNSELSFSMSFAEENRKFREALEAGK